ncbi:MAG TPA: DUF1801 domain-containing protein [Allosphingosinicella sp.]|nr:DUF1801 domain-containing protein [Allosphingosinicella sp.]
MAENKTKPTEVGVDAFLDSVPDPQRREDARRLCATMERLSGEPPVMWGPSIVGFGHCRYRYESGREGEMPRIGFSPRAKELVLYLVGGFPRHQALMDRLGKHRTGKSCLYVKRLADLDEEVLQALILEALAHMRETYPEEA